MNELEEKQRKRRFWIWLLVTVVVGAACFYSGYNTGKVACDHNHNAGSYTMTF